MKLCKDCQWARPHFGSWDIAECTFRGPELGSPSKVTGERKVRIFYAENQRMFEGEELCGRDAKNWTERTVPFSLMERIAHWFW